MANIKPFRCVRPAAEKAASIAALPYDVYDRKEAKAVVEANPDSFLRIDRPETQFPDDMDMYAPEVYEKARELFKEAMDRGDFLREEEPGYYIYELTMNGKIQTGIVAVASIDDYLNGVIKKHENTRADKEQDRICHVDTLSAQTGPIFLAYRSNEAINQVVKLVKEGEPLYDFTAEDGIRHRVFAIADSAQIRQIEAAFAQIQSIYIADGHHRAASAVKVGLMRRAGKQELDGIKTETGIKDSDFFLSVLFCDEELLIMDYNRVVKDLNGMTEQEFLAQVQARFHCQSIDGEVSVASSKTLEEVREESPKPGKKGEFSMFLGGCWYRCQFMDADRSEDPVDGLDVSLLQNLLLDPVLGIKDPKTDQRIDFVGGIRGLKELEIRCMRDAKVAFAMYPTSIEELFAVADAGRLMPPKSTWFEPKLRSGLFIHEI